MIRAYGARKIREAEAPLLAAGVPLMERASGALALSILRLLGGAYGRRCLVLAGTGNNGGDALFAGAFLARRGMGVTVAVAAGAHPAGLDAAKAAGCSILDIAGAPGKDKGENAEAAERVGRIAEKADVWIDGILGIGARGGLREPFAAIVERLEIVRKNARRRKGPSGRPVVVAVDVPSGIGTDDGVTAGPILHADVTVTMGAPKPGLFLDPAKRYAGRVETVDIGLDLEAPDLVSIELADLARLWPVPGPSSHKYTRGVVGVWAGSASYPGAGFLCVSAALAAGPGMVRYAGTLGSDIVARYPEVVLNEGHVDARVIGPGLDEAALAQAEPTVNELRRRGWADPVVLDAAALAWAERGMTPAVVLTPHAGELAALFTRLGIDQSREDIIACPADAARRASEATGATVVLKGPVDVIASPGKPLCVQAGTPWRATAGAGDVLAGMIGTLLAAGLETDRAAALAACAHGLASENGPMRAGDIVRNIPTVVRMALTHSEEEL